MKTSEIVRYVGSEYSRYTTAQTVRNWQKRGRAGVVLPADPSAAAIKKFISEAGVTFARGRPEAVTA
jgi:hypothetical protein